MNFVHLILRQRLGGKKIQRARFRLLQNTLEHRQIVTKRFAAGGGRDQHDILAVADKADSLRLMPIKFFHAAFFENIEQARIYPRGIVFKIAGFSGNFHHGGGVGGEAFILFEAGNPFFKS